VAVVEPRRAGRGADADIDADIDTDADAAHAFSPLQRYEVKTQAPLDLLALLTMWLVVVPPGLFGNAWLAATITRATLSLIFVVDIVTRVLLAGRHWFYARTHPVGLLAALLPPLRIALSLRLVRSVFQRGNLGRFLVAAGILVMNGAIAVYFYERHAPGGNIRTVGDAVWWSLVTVTSVGYGDEFPVTPRGRVAAVFIMAVGLLTLAVVTAQVASSFVDQGRQARGAVRPGGPAGGDAAPSGASPNATPPPATPTLSDLDRRLARIERLLEGRAPVSRDAVDHDVAGGNVADRGG